MKIVGRKDIKARVRRYICVDFETTKNFDNCDIGENQELCVTQRLVTVTRRDSG